MKIIKMITDIYIFCNLYNKLYRKSTVNVAYNY